MNRKSQLSQALIYVLALIIIAGILLIGYKMVSSVMKTKAGSEIELLKSGIKNDVDRMMREYDNTRNFTKAISSRYEEVCFADPEKDIQVQMNEIVKDSIESGSENNIFLIGDEVVAFKINNLQLTNPYYICYENTGIISYTLKGKGSFVYLILEPEIAEKPPEITQIRPQDSDVSTEPGDELTFSFIPIDEDTPITIKWFVNGAEQPEQTASLTQTILEGTTEIKALAIDSKDLVSSVGWNVRAVTEVNHPPEIIQLDNIVIDGESANLEYGTNPYSFTVMEGQSIQFRINATDPDRDILFYSAKIPEELLAPPGSAAFYTGSKTFVWTASPETQGTYTVTFTVSDEEEDISIDVQINVK